MVAFQQDQAAGLRRMMGATHPRLVTVLSTSGQSQSPLLLTNIASSLSANGNQVLLVHPSNITFENRYRLDEIPALLDVANYQTPLIKALQEAPEGFAVAKLTHANDRELNLGHYQQAQLDTVFEDLTKLYDIVMVDAALDANQSLPLQRLNRQEILIELSNDPQAIMQAYGLIKRICAKVGKRSFSIVVSNASDAQADQVFNRIAGVAWEYLKITLSYFGAIPADEYLNQAAMAGRSVIDTFPGTMAAQAFRQIAQKLDQGLRLSLQSNTLTSASMT